MKIFEKPMLELLSEDKEDLKEELLMILATQSYIEGDFLLASGKRSNFYIDGKQTTLDSKGITLISTLFYKMLHTSAQAVGGMSVGADPLCTSVSLLSCLNGKPLNAFYVRKEPKKHGTSKWIEGPIKSGLKISILEDVVTTGGSSIKAIEKFKEFGCEVLQVLSIVDRKSGGKEAFSSLGIDYKFLFEIDEVIEKAKTLKK